jgi:hypothetical protein
MELRKHQLTVWIAAFALAVMFTPRQAVAIDGGSAAASSTYYEQLLAGGSLADLESSQGGLPQALHVVDAAGGVDFQLLETAVGVATWEVTLEVAERSHERVDAVYDLVLALPLPAAADGGAAFEAKQWGITAREGSKDASVAFIYGGEKVKLKRNVALERTWLPLLVGARDGLPDISDTGYVHTLWDAVLRYDPGYGDRLQGLATLRYQTGAEVMAPDPEDERNAAYVITWIPTLDPSVPPFTIRLDIRPPPEQ